MGVGPTSKPCDLPEMPVGDGIEWPERVGVAFSSKEKLRERPQGRKGVTWLAIKASLRAEKWEIFEGWTLPTSVETRRWEVLTRL